MSKIRHELLSDVADHSALLIRDYGVDGDIADQVAHAIADHLATSWGGQVITIPKDHHFKLSKRDKEIYAKFTGLNHSELAMEYRIGVQRIYNIVKRQGKIARTAKQPDFFD